MNTTERTVHINSQLEIVGHMPNPFADAIIKDEPMMFSADAGYAFIQGGPITRSFINKLIRVGWLGQDHKNWERTDVIIDSRVHMLMPGWFPCIPGWHLDDVPRTREDGQPDHLNPAYKSEHILCCVGDCSLTKLAIGECDLIEPPLGETVYAKWHNDVEQLITDGALRLEEAPDGALVRFTWETLHRGDPATKNGWRFFIRASRHTDRKVLNEIRRQVQVYLPSPMAGW